MKMFPTALPAALAAVHAAAWRASHKGEWEHPKRKGRTQEGGRAR